MQTLRKAPEHSLCQSRKLTTAPLCLSCLSRLISLSWLSYSDENVSEQYLDERSRSCNSSSCNGCCSWSSSSLLWWYRSARLDLRKVWFTVLWMSGIQQLHLHFPPHWCTMGSTQFSKLKWVQLWLFVVKNQVLMRMWAKYTCALGQLQQHLSHEQSISILTRPALESSQIVNKMKQARNNRHPDFKLGNEKNYLLVLCPWFGWLMFLVDLYIL